MLQPILDKISTAKAKTIKMNIDRSSPLYGELSKALTDAKISFTVLPGKGRLTVFTIQTQWKKKD